MTIRQLVGNSVYIDVDANIGAIALPVAEAGTRVIADVIRWLIKFRPSHACAERIASGQGVPVLAVLLTSHHQTAGRPRRRTWATDRAWNRRPPFRTSTDAPRRPSFFHRMLSVGGTGIRLQSQAEPPAMPTARGFYSG
jgi:hypothetical protein